MTRIRRFAVLGILCAFVASASVVAQAGDSDGVAGYSMRLKNKNFDDGNYGSGNLTYSSDKNQAEASTEISSDGRLQEFGWRMLWVRSLALLFWLR